MTRTVSPPTPVLPPPYPSAADGPAADALGVAPLPELTELARLATVMARVSSAGVKLLDDRAQYTIATHGPLLTPNTCAAEDALCSRVFRTARVTVAEDASTDPRFADSPFVTGERGAVRFYASATLIARDGTPLGTLCVVDDRPGTLDDAQRDALQVLARQVVDSFELRRRDRMLRAKIEELERSQQQLVSFAGQISHDLKTPLTSIIGFAEMASDRDSVRADDVALRYVERTQASGRRMLGLIDDLLDYARVGGTLRREPIALCAMLDQVKSDLRWPMFAAGTEVTCGDHVLAGDPSQIRLLLQNLLTNAVKYGRSVGGRISVAVETTAAGATLVFADNGSGIPPEQRAVVLEPLARLRDDVPGTGLGLATCQRIARAHGGQLRLAETPGGGLTVLVDLPEAPPPDELQSAA